MCIKMLLDKSLKMLGLYLDTLIVCHKCCSMLSILNALTLEKRQKIKNNNNTTKKQT